MRERGSRNTNHIPEPVAGSGATIGALSAAAAAAAEAIVLIGEVAAAGLRLAGF